uniref:Uncharacterized protein n=1 Tax=Picea glauca TaxID=3330 RepID=A0A101LWP6_PICGL|nr:hypothetical protein ABT39_MTgene1424 [Picea glauca]
MELCLLLMLSLRNGIVFYAIETLRARRKHLGPLFLWSYVFSLCYP